MKNHFTPGEWGPASSVGNEGYGRYNHIIAGGKITISQTLLGSSCQEIEANVRMITASKKLYAACKLALSDGQNISQGVAHAIIDAVAEAEGRT